MWVRAKMMRQDGWARPIGWSTDGVHGSVLHQNFPSWRELDLEFCKCPP